MNPRLGFLIFLFVLGAWLAGPPAYAAECPRDDTPEAITALAVTMAELQQYPPPTSAQILRKVVK